VLNEETQTVTLKTAEITSVTFENEKIKGYIQITKTSDEDNEYSELKKGSPLQDVTFEIYDPEDNLVDTITTDAVRLEKIYSGTWNEDLKYSVWYKTNTSEEYILFAENLSTTTNNELDFTTLQFAENEYITDFEFLFDTVKIGYQEIETPVVYCKIIDGLENGYTFTNNIKVSGTYIEKYVEDDDNWTTVIYKKEIELTKVLPRTVY